MFYFSGVPEVLFEHPVYIGWMDYIYEKVPRRCYLPSNFCLVPNCQGFQKSDSYQEAVPVWIVGDFREQYGVWLVPMCDQHANHSKMLRNVRINNIPFQSICRMPHQTPEREGYCFGMKDHCRFKKPDLCGKHQPK